MAEQQKSSYTSEEAEEILTRAAQKRTHGQVSHANLLAMAEELGITPAEVEEAIAETQARREEAAQRQEFARGRRAEFWPHLLTYLGVMALLLFLNLAKSPERLWFFYPLIAWGVAVVIHAAHALPAAGATFETEFAAWRRKKAQSEQRKARRSAKKAAAATTAATQVSPPASTAAATAPSVPTVTVASAATAAADEPQAQVQVGRRG